MPPTSSLIGRRFCRCCAGRRRALTISPAGAGGKPPSPGHPYGRPVSGTPETLPTITIDDLKSYTHRVLARQNLKIAVVGDIDAETLKPLLDRVFGALPAKPDLDAGRQRHAARSRPPDRRQPRRAAGGGRFRRSRHRAQRPRLHGRLCHQSHSRRRLVGLSALSRSAREARPGLFGLQQPDLARPFRGVSRRHRHPRRPRRRNARSHRRRKSTASRNRGRPRRNSPRPKTTSSARSRSISTPRPRSRRFSCNCSSTISASIISSSAAP